MDDKVLICNPDRYGRFGHQSFSIIGPLLIAYITGSRLALPRYMYFAEKYNTIVDWRKSALVCTDLPKQSNIVYLENKVPDSVGNRKWALDSLESLQDLIQVIAELPSNTLAFLPFDQSTGLLEKLLNQEYVRSFIRSAFPEKCTRLMPNAPYACIHIRRGDVSIEKHPQFFVSDDFYLELLSILSDLLPVDWVICVCTQGDSSWLSPVMRYCQSSGRKLILSSTASAWTNDSEIGDFLLMKDSDILFAAGSSFSRLAAVVGSQKLVFDVDKNGHNPLDYCRTLCTDPANLSYLREIIIQDLRKSHALVS